MKWQLNPNYKCELLLSMFHLLLLVCVMILDNFYFKKISTDDDIEKQTIWVGSSARQGLSDPTIDHRPHIE